MAFWGCEVKPGKATPFVPPPESSKLHLSQACLSTSAKPGAKAALKVRVDEGEPLLVCALREGGSESMGLDLIFDQYTEFSVEGGASIHLTGYFMPEYEMGGEESDEDDEEGPGGYGGRQILGFDEYGVPVMADEYDSQEDSDYESEDSEDDEEMDGDLEPPRRSVVIEDVTELERQQKLKALLAPELANGKAADFSDEDVDASDEEEEGEEGEDDDEEEEEDSEEEEEDDQAQAAQQQQQAGLKRKADKQPAAAKQQQAKQPKQQQAATPAAGKQQQQQKAAPATAEKQPKQKQPKQQVAPATAEKQQQEQQPQQKAAEAPASTGKSKVRKFPNGFEIEDVKMGRPDGKLAKAGKKVVMRYVGKLKSNGKVFDQTKGSATFPFRLGVGEVIKGWDRGVEGMRVGDKRRLTIPPQMAYGSTGVRGTIPPNAWLMFDVELVDVK